MKKTLTLLLSVSLAFVTLTGCGAKDKTETAVAETTVTEAPKAEETAEAPASGDAVKTGLAVISSAAKSKDAAEEDGLAQADSTVVAVTVDKDGKIVKCVIDAAQTKINFSKTGELTTDVKSEFKTKVELGADYGMAKASSIGKEWADQAAALADYVVGKTVEEVKGIAVNEKGAPSDAELAASVTVGIGNYVSAIEKAVANAKELGATSADKLGLGVVTNIAKSKNAAEEDGLAQAYSSYAALTFGADGKITSAIIDGSQTNINFSKEGKITSDINAAQMTKVELGEKYGMKKASGIGKEWFEQADALSKYIVGKTIEEVKGIAVNEEGAPTDAELTASVTIKLGDHIKNFEKASANAK
ncbi:MAG: hypothetical protein K0R69_324 [Clostridia bacterium]|nr:hypothetical protein [Clostridia bacterium]